MGGGLALPKVVPSRDAHSHPAVDGHVFTKNEVVLHQHENRGRNVLGGSFAVQRNPISNVMLHLFRRQVVLKTGSNDAWRHRIHSDVILRQFSRQAASKLCDRPFCDSVPDRAGAAPRTGSRRNQDNRALLAFDHVWYSGAAEMKNRVDMYFERPVPHFGTYLHHSTRRRRSRTMNQYVEPAELLDGFPDRALG